MLKNVLVFFINITQNIRFLHISPESKENIIKVHILLCGCVFKIYTFVSFVYFILCFLSNILSYRSITSFKVCEPWLLEPLVQPLVQLNTSSKCSVLDISPAHQLLALIPPYRTDMTQRCW